MNTLKSVFSKIAEDKTELAKHKVELGVIDDNLKMYDNALKEFDKASEIRVEAARKYIDAADLFSKVSKEAVKTIDMADSLGIPIPKLETALKESQRLEKIAKEYAKELR